MRHAPRLIGCAAASLSIAVACATHAAEIHKCTDRGAIAYQTSPCAASQTELAVLKTPGASKVAESTDAMTTRANSERDDIRAVNETSAPRGARWLPFRRKTLVPGMTDDEVLNTPNGGVPTKISRAREGRLWRERWTYALRDGTSRELEFVNGTLMTIVDDAAGGAMALRLAVAQ